MLSPGRRAPSFALPDQDDNIVTLAQQAGHWLLLWWYPRAATPG